MRTAAYPPHLHNRTVTIVYNPQQSNASLMGFG